MREAGAIPIATLDAIFAYREPARVAEGLAGSGWAVGVITLRLDRTADGRTADNVSYALKGAVLHKFVSGTPEAAQAMKTAPAEKSGDGNAIITRAKGASATVLVPN